MVVFIINRGRGGGNSCGGGRHEGAQQHKTCVELIHIPLLLVTPLKKELVAGVWWCYVGSSGVMDVCGGRQLSYAILLSSVTGRLPPAPSLLYLWPPGHVLFVMRLLSHQFLLPQLQHPSNVNQMSVTTNIYHAHAHTLRILPDISSTAVFVQPLSRAPHTHTHSTSRTHTHTPLPPHAHAFTGSQRSLRARTHLPHRGTCELLT